MLFRIFSVVSNFLNAKCLKLNGFWQCCYFKMKCCFWKAICLVNLCILLCQQRNFWSHVVRIWNILCNCSSVDAALILWYQIDINWLTFNALCACCWQRYGQGVMKYSNGDVYNGGFEYDLCSKNGKMTYKDGSVYEGLWSNGLVRIIFAHATYCTVF